MEMAKSQLGAEAEAENPNGKKVDTLKDKNNRDNATRNIRGPTKLSEKGQLESLRGDKQLERWILRRQRKRG